MTLLQQSESVDHEAFRLDTGTLVTIIFNTIALLLGGTSLYISLQGELITLSSKVDLLLKNNNRFEVWMADVDKRNASHETVSALLRRDVDRIQSDMTALQMSDRSQEGCLSMLKERHKSNN